MPTKAAERARDYDRRLKAALAAWVAKRELCALLQLHQQVIWEVG